LVFGLLTICGQWLADLRTKPVTARHLAALESAACSFQAKYQTLAVGLDVKYLRIVPLEHPSRVERDELFGEQVDCHGTVLLDSNVDCLRVPPVFW
jgi:hypothetical protein